MNAPAPKRPLGPIGAVLQGIGIAFGLVLVLLAFLGGLAQPLTMVVAAAMLPAAIYPAIAASPALMGAAIFCAGLLAAMVLVLPPRGLRWAVAALLVIWLGLGFFNAALTGMNLIRGI